MKVAVVRLADPGVSVGVRLAAAMWCDKMLKGANAEYLQLEDAGDLSDTICHAVDSLKPVLAKDGPFVHLALFVDQGEGIRLGRVIRFNETDTEAFWANGDSFLDLAVYARLSPYAQAASPDTALTA